MHHAIRDILSCSLAAMRAKDHLHGSRYVDLELQETTSQAQTRAIVHLQVGQMTCSSCSLAVEQALASIPGVHSVAVSLMQAEAKVEYDQDSVTLDQLIDVVQDAGFEGKVIDQNSKDTLMLQIGGMTCTSCSTAVEQRLKELPGVSSPAVSLLSGKAEVQYNAALTGARDIITAIEDLGYSAQLVNPDNFSSGMDERSREIHFWKRKFWLGFVFTLPVFLLAMVFAYTPDTKHGLDANVGGFTIGELIKWALTTPVLVYVGWSFHVGAFKALRRGRANMDVLISLGSTISYAYSIISMVHRQQQYEKGVKIDSMDYFETAALLITFLSLGKLLEALAKGKTSEAITKLLRLAPSSAILVTQDSEGQTISEEEVTSALIQCNDLLKVLPGARIPADGVVYRGKSFVDESMITGESKPVTKKIGAEVIAGSVNGSSSIIIKATRVGPDTTLQQIVRLVEGAQLSKPPIQAVADRISAYFVPFVIIAALATWTGWFIAGKAHAFPEDWYPQGSNAFLFALLFGISTLVIACPCALGLATPTAVMVGSGVAAAQGILIKGAPALEAAQKVKIVVFDKTGTLTQGQPAVVDHQIFHRSLPETEILHLAAAAEASSEHPLAQAILTHAHIEIKETLQPFDVETQSQQSNQTDPKESFASSPDWSTDRAWVRQIPEDAEILPGKGVKCWVPTTYAATCAALTASSSSGAAQSQEVRVLLGTRQLMAEEGVQVPGEVSEYMRMHELDGATVILMAAANSVVAAFAVRDPIKPEAAAVIAALTAAGIKCYMVSGDNWTTARIVAEQLGIHNVMAEVLPAGKADKVRELQTVHKVAVAMVGDGINDSPALAQADVGIAIGSGTDIAIEAADFVLMKSNLEDVLIAVDLSRKTFRRIWLNYIWALGYNVCMIPLAAGALYGPMRFQLPPWAAGGAMALSSVSVVCSSLLLRLYKRPPKLASKTDQSAIRERKRSRGLESAVHVVQT